MSYLQLSKQSSGLRRCRPGAASSAEQQRLEVSPFFPSPRSGRGRTPTTSGASKTEWHRVCVFRPRLAEYVANDDQERRALCSSRAASSARLTNAANGKGKKAKTNKQTFWCIRADVVRKLDRGEPEPEALASGSNASDHTPEASDTAPF